MLFLSEIKITINPIKYIYNKVLPASGGYTSIHPSKTLKPYIGMSLKNLKIKFRFFVRADF